MLTIEIYDWLYTNKPTVNLLLWSGLASHYFIMSKIDPEQDHMIKLANILEIGNEYGIKIPNDDTAGIFPVINGIINGEYIDEYTNLLL
jgi:hypothetical protein